MRILIVDDDPAVRRMLRQIVERNGHMADSAMSYLQARASLAAAPYDLLLTDYDLGRGTALGAGSGLDLAEWVVSLSPAMPIVFCTGSADTKLREWARARNLDVLPKPFVLEDLEGVLARHAPR